jgi:hypothetical protein
LDFSFSLLISQLSGSSYEPKYCTPLELDRERCCKLQLTAPFSVLPQQSGARTSYRRSTEQRSCSVQSRAEGQGVVVGFIFSSQTRWLSSSQSAPFLSPDSDKRQRGKWNACLPRVRHFCHLTLIKGNGASGTHEVYWNYYC